MSIAGTMTDYFYQYNDLEMTIDEIVGSAVANGVPLATVVNELAAETEVREELVAAIVSHSGSIGAAQAIVDDVPALRGLSVDDVLARAASKWVLVDACRSGENLSGALLALETAGLGPSQRAHWIRAIALSQPLADICSEVIHRPRPVLCDVLRAALPSGALASIEALAAHFEAEQVAALVVALGIAAEQPGDPRVAVATLHASLLADVGLNPLPALCWLDATVPVDAWLASFRRSGLSATAAVLEVRERFPALPLLTVIQHMTAAGYRDDLLEALRMNGIGTSTTLKSLARCGWHVDSMVADLLRNGMLSSDARDELLALGLSRPAIRDVLLRHVSEDVVDLVVPS